MKRNVMKNKGLGKTMVERIVYRSFQVSSEISHCWVVWELTGVWVYMYGVEMALHFQPHTVVLLIKVGDVGLAQW